MKIHQIHENPSNCIKMHENLIKTMKTIKIYVNPWNKHIQIFFKQIQLFLNRYNSVTNRYNSCSNRYNSFSNRYNSATSWLGWARLKKWILGDPRDPRIFGMDCGWPTRAQLLVERKLFFSSEKLFFWTKVFLDIFAWHRIYIGFTVERTFEDFWAKPRCAHISLTRANREVCFEGPRSHPPKNWSGSKFSRRSREGPKP